TISRLNELAEIIQREGSTIAFGAPERGLDTILDSVATDTDPDRRSEWFDIWLNTIPNQGSKTVRTEEAMFASLACLTLTE
ncbi:MAG: putative RNA uridine N3 methyltransferase, partial [Halobacteriaceae archaeon]